MNPDYQHCFYFYVVCYVIKSSPIPPPPAGRHFGLGQEEKTKIHLNYLTSPDLIQWDNTHPYIHITQAQRNSRWQMYSHTNKHTQSHTHTTLKNNKEVGRRKLTICSNISCSTAACCWMTRLWLLQGCWLAISLFFPSDVDEHAPPRSLLWCCVDSGGWESLGLVNVAVGAGVGRVGVGRRGGVHRAKHRNRI